MVLGFFNVDQKDCQPFKVFSRKKSGVGKTTNLPPTNTHISNQMKEHTTFRPRPYHFHSILQAENDLATIGFLE